MMNFIKKNKVVVIIVSIIILIVALIVVTLLFNKKKNEPLGKGVYIIDGVYKSPDFVTIKGRKLRKEKCLKKICVSNVVIDTTDNYNKVTYTLKNKSKKTQSGYIKIIFGDVEETIAYSDLKAGEKIKSMATGMCSLKNTTDYELRELTEDELMNIIRR